jgi:AAA family ATP:ADP antiporter
MFVQRFAKAVAVGMSLGITTFFTDFSAVRWLSAFTVPIIVLWIVAVRYAGREFARRTEGLSSP